MGAAFGRGRATAEVEGRQAVAAFHRRRGLSPACGTVNGFSWSRSRSRAVLERPFMPGRSRRPARGKWPQFRHFGHSEPNGKSGNRSPFRPAPAGFANCYIRGGRGYCLRTVGSLVTLPDLDGLATVDKRLLHQPVEKVLHFLGLGPSAVTWGDPQPAAAAPAPPRLGLHGRRPQKVTVPPPP